VPHIDKAGYLVEINVSESFGKVLTISAMFIYTPFFKYCLKIVDVNVSTAGIVSILKCSRNRLIYLVFFKNRFMAFQF